MTTIEVTDEEARLIHHFHELPDYSKREIWAQMSIEESYLPGMHCRFKHKDREETQ